VRLAEAGESVQPHILPYLSVVIPIGLLGVLASLQNIESASAAGDNYPVVPSLVFNGLGTLAAAAMRNTALVAPASKA